MLDLISAQEARRLARQKRSGEISPLEEIPREIQALVAAIRTGNAERGPLSGASFWSGN